MSVRFDPAERRSFIGGSDARVIMGDDESALHRLWGEKRPAKLGRRISPAASSSSSSWARHREPRPAGTGATHGQTVECVQHRLRHPVVRWMGATLDGMIAGSGAVFEAKFMLPWSFSEEAAAEKHMAQLQHNMWVTNARAAALSIITGGGKWVEITITADSLYQHLLLTAEKKFWLRRKRRAPLACSELSHRGFGRGSSAASTWPRQMPGPSLPCLRFAGPDRPSSSTGSAKAELKGLMPADSKEASRHGIPGQAVEIQGRWLRELRCPEPGAGSCAQSSGIHWHHCGGAC